MPTYNTRCVNLEDIDLSIVKRVAAEKGLGEKGFSAALRLIIREWEAFSTGQIQLYPPYPPEQE